MVHAQRAAWKNVEGRRCFQSASGVQAQSRGSQQGGQGREYNRAATGSAQGSPSGHAMPQTRPHADAGTGATQFGGSAGPGRSNRSSAPTAPGGHRPIQQGSRAGGFGGRRTTSQQGSDTARMAARGAAATKAADDAHKSASRRLREATETKARKESDAREVAKAREEAATTEPMDDEGSGPAVSATAGAGAMPAPAPTAAPPEREGPPAEEVEVLRSGGDTDEHVSAPPAPLPSGARTTQPEGTPASQQDAGDAPPAAARPVRIQRRPTTVAEDDPLIAAAVGNEREKKQPLKKRSIMQSMTSQMKTATDIITSPGWLRKTPRPSVEDEAGSPGAPPPMRREARADLEARCNAARSLFIDQQQESQAQPPLAQPLQAGSMPAPPNGSHGTSADSSAAPSSPTPMEPDEQH